MGKIIKSGLGFIATPAKEHWWGKISPEQEVSWNGKTRLCRRSASTYKKKDWDVHLMPLVFYWKGDT